MNETDMIDYITRAFAGVTTVVADDNTFFFYDPDHMFPFATLMTNDVNDQFSNLARPGVYRLNIGVGKETFLSLFGDAAGDYDFTTLDTLMPHPVYGRQRWVCVLNPSAATFESSVQPLLAEAYDRDVRKHTRK
jgi:hypothetical protein